MDEDDELRARLTGAGYDAPGFAESYDRYRPAPPAAVVDLLHDLVVTPQLIVDLGCGTGISTRIWADTATRVVGIEPVGAMVAHAERVTDALNVEYRCTSAYATGLPDECADIVTASQSLHWMRPERVFPEIDRILRRSGVFCAYEYFALLTPLWEPEQAFADLRRRTAQLRGARGLDRTPGWPAGRERLDESGVFRHTRELVLHSIEAGDGDRLVGFALSEGSLRTLLATGVTEDEVGLTRVRETAAAIREPVPWWLGYRVWLGLK